METLSKVRDFTDHPDYVRDRLNVLSDIKLENLDVPIRDIVIAFRKQYPNSYALQVEPRRFALLDEAFLEHSEVLHVLSVRELFFQRVREVQAETAA